MKKIESEARAHLLTTQVLVKSQRSPDEYRRFLMRLVTGEYLGVPVYQFVHVFLGSDSLTHDSYHTEDVQFRGNTVQLHELADRLHTVTCSVAYDEDSEESLHTVDAHRLTIETALYLYFLNADVALQATIERYASLAAEYAGMTDTRYVLDFLNSNSELFTSALAISWMYGIQSHFFTTATPHRERLFLLVLADRIRHFRKEIPHASSADIRRAQYRERNVYLRSAHRQLRALTYQPVGSISSVIRKRADTHRSATVRTFESSFIGGTVQNTAATEQTKRIDSLLETARTELTDEELEVVAEVQQLLEEQFGESAVERCGDYPVMSDMPLDEFRKTYGFHGLNSGGRIVFPSSLPQAQWKNVLQHEYRHNLLSLLRKSYGFALTEALIEDGTEYPEAYYQERYFFRQLMRMLHLAVPSERLAKLYPSDSEITVFELLIIAAHTYALKGGDTEAQQHFDAALLHAFGVDGMLIAYFTRSAGMLLPSAVVQSLFPPMQSIQMLSTLFSAKSCVQLSNTGILESPDKAFYFEQELARAVEDPHFNQLHTVHTIEEVCSTFSAEFLDVLIQQQLFLLAYNSWLMGTESRTKASQPLADQAKEVLAQLFSFRARVATGIWVEPKFWRVGELSTEESYYNWVAWMETERKKQQSMTAESVTENESSGAHVAA